MIERSASLPPEQRNQLRQAAISQWTMSNPDEAVAWIRSLPADEQKPLRETAGQMMFMMKPGAESAAFMLEGVEDKDRGPVYDRVVMQWAGQDARGAGEWLTSQPQGPELDGARSTYAVIVAQRDPAAAMDWARSIQDVEQRAQSIGQVFNTWRARDAAAATAALNASGLPPDKVKEIMQQGPPGQNIVPAPTAIRAN